MSTARHGGHRTGGDGPVRDLGSMRKEYRPLAAGAAADEGLREADLPAHWVTLFEAWLADAVAAHLPEPNAMIVATASAGGVPSARTVLLKAFDPAGFVFYTNYTSRKGTELSANPQASLVFPWYPLHRQVVVCGTVTRVDRAQTEAYFATRPRDSQLGAWASPQSQPVADRDVLDDAWRRTDHRFPAGTAVPAPPHWGGFLVSPLTVEFWQGRTGRLHDRLCYVLVSPDGTGGPSRDQPAGWRLQRLAP